MIHAAAPYLYWNQELILIALDAVALQVRMHQCIEQTVKNNGDLSESIGVHACSCFVWVCG